MTHSCAKVAAGNCSSSNAKGDRALFMCKGVWYCRAHLPDKSWRDSCTHSLGFGLGSCPYCGAPKLTP